MSGELDEQMIELTIEALTGTVYDLCVSPFETILGIKMKIQRLEGIPVYQQQLVHDNIELHDEFCLEEYSIGSGAQLKLLLAMRGGPIHAHRVQLEDPTLLEIAEVLESRDLDLDHKYTVMLLREGDMVDMTDLVQVVTDESPGHASPLPQAATAEQETTSLALSKVTRNKMQELMFRLRSRRQPSQASEVNDAHSGSELHRSTAKLLILNSRSSSRLFRSSAPSPLTPHPKGTPTTTQASSAVHRKLVFPAEDGETTISDSCTGSEEAPLLRHKEARLGEGGASSTHPDQQQQECSHNYSHRQPINGPLHHHERLHPHKQSTDRHHRHWRRHHRLRRPSCLQENTTPTTQHKHHDVNELSKELSRLGLRQKERSKIATDILPPLPSTKSAVKTHYSQCSGVPQLPAISVNHAPCLTGRRGSNDRPHCAQCGKKTGLASTYTCRCKGIFCSLHRYSEAHNCPFDYKAQGREAIARSNPLVVAPKLPKI